MDYESVCDIVRKMESNYSSGTSTISKYVDFDMFETLNKIDAYLYSVHTTGPKDSLDRDKPFFNIVTAARNVWFRATDIDRKDIKLRVPYSTLMAETVAANMLLKQWMKKSNFGVYLNDWGRTLATYGSAVTKFVEKDGELNISVTPWNRIICDSMDFDGNVKIEVLEFTPAQLRKQKGYDQDMVKSLLDSLSSREDLGKQKKDNKADYIKVYEVHGELSVADYKQSKGLKVLEGDDDIYKQQMHVVSFVSSKPTGRGNYAKKYQDFTLFSGYEKQDPYQKDDLITEDGRTLGIGAIEHLFESQWMVNHTVKQMKDTLDFASLLILQTSDQTFVGRNALQDLVTGDFLIHAENQPATQLNNTHDITQIQAFNSLWQNVGKEITATPDAIRGNTQPSGTAYRLQQLITSESHSLFELMTENKGLAIEKMLRTFIIPYIKTKMDTSQEISALLESDGITQFDSMYVPNEAVRRNNAHLKASILHPDFTKQQTAPAQNLDPIALQGQIKGELAPLGNQRFLTPADISDKTWKEVLSAFEWEPDIIVTNESEEVADALTSLSSAFQTVASLAGRPMTPDERLVFNKIMEKSGSVSPLQLNQVSTQQPIGGSSVVPINQPQPAMPVTAGK